MACYNPLLAEEDFGKDKMARYRRTSSVFEPAAVLSRDAPGQTGRALGQSAAYGAAQGGASPGGPKLPPPPT